MKRKVACIATHPYDEVLGGGGPIARHIQAGNEVYGLIRAEGVTSRDRQRHLARWRGASIGVKAPKPSSLAEGLSAYKV